MDNSLCLISGIHREVAENCALMGYYTASSGNFLPTFQDNGTDSLSQNVGKKLLCNNPEECISQIVVL
jgi:hypothetical protein